MEDYCESIKLVEERKEDDWQRPLTEYEKKVLSSAVGQVNWAGAARQCRYDLSFGASHVQQLAGAGDPQALVWLDKLIRRSHQDFIMKIAYLGCPIEELVVLSISDAAYGAQPKGGSQGGLIVAMADPDVQRGEARLAVVRPRALACSEWCAAVWRPN